MYKNNLSQSLGIFSNGRTCSEKTSLFSEQVAGVAAGLRRRSVAGQNVAHREAAAARPYGGKDPLGGGETAVPGGARRAA